MPERKDLHAGPLSLVYEDGDLRYIKWGDREIWRRVYVAIRDKDWGTVLPVYSEVEIEIGDLASRIRYQAHNKRDDIDVRWRGEIIGGADGTIIFSMDGAAQSTFLRNRIGFCVLHPAACAGASCLIEHVDGTVERANLPIHIVADVPVQPFAEMKALAHEVVPGVWAEARFSGDIFEMEDQRNWTDASFKTFCTLLRLPYPVEIKAGTRVAQSVALRVRDERPQARQQPVVCRADSASGLTLCVASRGTLLPQIGLSVGSHGQPLSRQEMERLRALHLHHLRVDVLLSEPAYPDNLSRAAAEACSLGLPMEVALLLTEDAETELQRFRPVLDRLMPLVGRWLIYPRRESDTRVGPTTELVTFARRHLATYDPTACFGAGTNGDFFLLQLNPPPVSLLDLVCFAITPQTHAFDHASIVETLEAQAAVVDSARRLACGLPIVVSPVTLKPRFNPYATGPTAETPPDQLPPQVDERQMSLIGAGWTVGSLKYLAQSDVCCVTYYETTGWRGAMETEAGSPLPEKFPSLPGCVFPLYHVLADVGEFAGGEVIKMVASHPLRVDGLAVRRGSRTRVILANLIDKPQRVTVRNLAKRVRVRHLDETNVEAAMRSPEDFRAQEGELQQTSAAALDLNLLPYAIVRIDSQSAGAANLHQSAGHGKLERL